MDAKQFRIQNILNKAIVCFTFVLVLYLLLSTISYNSTTLIGAIINSSLAIRLINASIIGIMGMLTIGWFLVNKKYFKLKPTLIFLSLMFVYTIYYFISGKLQSLPLNEIISNIKQILSILMQMYFVMYVLSKILKIKHIKIIYISLLLLILMSYAYVIIVDYHNIISAFAEKNLYDFSIVSPFNNKNTIGLLMFFAVLISTYLFLIEKKKIYAIAFTFLFILNILSLCKTSIICVMIFSILLLFYFKNRSTKRIIVQIFLISVSLVIVTLFLLLLFKVINIPALNNIIEDLRHSSFGTITSRYILITRTAALLNYKNVWLGNGYASSLLILQETAESNFHNSYMYLLNTGGMLLTLIYMCVFYKLFAQIIRIRKYDRHISYTITVMVLIYLGYSMFENIAFFSFSFISYLSTIIIASIPEVTYKLKFAKQENKTYKNIAFITTIYPTKNKKWYGIYLKNIAKSLMKLGHKLNVIYIHEGTGQVHNSIYDGILITHIYYKPSFVHKLTVPHGFKFKSDFEYIISKYNFDDAIIHFYPPAFQNYMIRTLKENKIKVLHYIHSRNIWKRVEEKRPLLRKLYYNHFYKNAYKKCDNIICVSKVVEDDIKSKLKKAPTRVVYNGVDNIFFNDIKNIKTINDKHIKLISIGNLYSIKGHKYVLKALKTLVEKYKDIKFEYVIIGNGVEKDNLNKMIKDYNLKRVVKFVDEMSQDKIKQFLLNYDIFILPSYYEALGCVYLEAMASGCYTIGCKHQGISEIITPCNGYLVNEYSDEDIVATIEDIIKNSRHNVYIRRNAIKTAKEYTWRQSAIELSKYL